MPTLQQGKKVWEKIRFYSHSHPFACEFVKRLQQEGLSGLMDLATQTLGEHPENVTPDLKPGERFENTKNPNKAFVARPYPPVTVDFSRGGAYSQYNWELFFHIPLLVADRLVQDGRGEQAEVWFRYIFNPATESTLAAPERYWRFRPFRELGMPESVLNLLGTLHDPTANRDSVEQAIDDWRRHPFEPHRIAQRRWGAYQKNVVAKCCDHWLGMGDKLFRRDNVNEATLMYMLVAEVVGLESGELPFKPTPPPKSYAELRAVGLDSLGNAAALVDLENLTAPLSPNPTSNARGPHTSLRIMSPYFCIPSNQRIAEYRHTVRDRLFKIRHCMNIEGVRRELPLFEPPIDPALLVRARAMGMDLSSILDALSAAAPHHRFGVLLRTAREFCEELKQLGSVMLSVLEKKDAEELAVLRASQEAGLLQAVREARALQVHEAIAHEASLARAQDLVTARQEHYEAVSERLPGEEEFLDKQLEALTWQMASQWAALQGSTAAMVPEVTAAAAGQASGTYTELSSGKKVALVANLVSTYLGWLGQIASLEGSTASYKAGLRRAQQDRDLQVQLAQRETKQLEQQILAAEIRRQIAEREVATHEQQVDQARETEAFLRRKFTDRDLYGWMESELASVFFRAYQLAYDMAKRAEHAYRFESGVQDSSYIQFGAWDGLRKGLLSGERLSLDLRRLEAAYLEQDRRRYEITRHVSLTQLDPWALVQLRETGSCEMQIPEALFDLDYPGHYQRRIKAVSLSLPAVTGPYTGLACTLTLLKHRIRSTTTNPDQDPDWQFGAVESIATSTGTQDAGVFELNFRDERLLPYEGAGAISHWRIELPDKNYRRFDYGTISDLVLHVSYTSREGGAAFKSARSATLHERLNRLATRTSESGAFRGFDIRRDFPSEWNRLGQGFAVPFTVEGNHLPYFLAVLQPDIVGATWLAQADLAPPLEVDGVPVSWEPQVDPELGLWISKPDTGPVLGKEFKVKMPGTGAAKDVAGLWLMIRMNVKKP